MLLPPPPPPATLLASPPLQRAEIWQRLQKFIHLRFVTATAVVHLCISIRLADARRSPPYSDCQFPALPPGPPAPSLPLCWQLLSSLPPSAYSQRRTEKNGSLLGTFFLSCFSATEAVEAAMIGKQIPSIRLCRLGWILWPFTIYHRLPQSTQTRTRRIGGSEGGCQN